MNNRLTLVVIDKDYELHNYDDVVYWVGIRNSERHFNIKKLKTTKNIVEELSKTRGYDSIISIGDVDFEPLNNLPFESRKKWIHLNEFEPTIIANSIVATFSGNIGRGNEGSETFSIFTSAYNTPPEYLERLYKSLLRQSYHNWNWWVLDDSSDDNTSVRDTLRGFNDFRINIIKNVSFHGSIGYNKHMIASVCDGDFLVEIDHDDELTDNCLEKIWKAWKKYPDADFFYSHTFEEVDGHLLDYGDYFALGLGTHETFNINGVPQMVCTTPDVNALSTRHIVALPNHVRCWRKDFYHKIGGHNTELSVLDDMDILIRTFLNGKMCKINDVLYIQHEGTQKNGGRGSTTQTYRMGEIWRVGVILKHRYDKEIHQRLIDLGVEDVCWKEDEERSDLYCNPQGLVSLNYTYDE